ncbi:MAG: nuclear transport factor 2 family protein [Proteobacteria bacterium]|nr:nuclear transport factor 2 family protein [Pseudomonadota bacterium]
MEEKTLTPEHVVRKVFDGQLNAHHKELVEKLWLQDVKYHEGDLTVVGRNKLESLIEERRGVLADLHYEIDDIFSDGEKVAVRWHGKSPSLQSSGHNRKYWGISIMIVRDGKIVENWESVSQKPLENFA